jgi:hypothetical protein
VSLADLKLLLRHSAEQLVPTRRFAADLQHLIDLVDYRARRPRACPVDVWLDLRFRSRDLQDELRQLTSTLRVACAYLEVDTKAAPDFGEWIRRKVEILAISALSTGGARYRRTRLGAMTEGKGK